MRNYLLDDPEYHIPCNPSRTFSSQFLLVMAGEEVYPADGWTFQPFSGWHFQALLF
jgi:hypothetical protein